MVFFAAATWLANTKDAASQTRGRALQGTRLPAHSKRQRGKGQAECKRFDLSFRRSRQVAEREPAISMPLSEPQMLAARARTTVAEARENCNPKMLLLRAHLVVLLGCRKKTCPCVEKERKKEIMSVRPCLETWKHFEVGMDQCNVFNGRSPAHICNCCFCFMHNSPVNYSTCAASFICSAASAKPGGGGSGGSGVGGLGPACFLMDLGAVVKLGSGSLRRP